jgi:PAS domain S-box-containing protein
MSSTEAVIPVGNQTVAALPNETTDLTVSKREREQQIFDNRYRRMFETAREGVVILDGVTLRITALNPFMSELSGYSHVECLGKELRDIGLLSDEGASEAAFLELQTKGHNHYYNLQLQTKDGTFRNVEFDGRTYKEDGGQVILCNLRDITEHNRVTECLNHTESQFRALFKNAPVAVLIADDLGVYVDANPAACELLAVPHEEVLGHTIHDFVVDSAKPEAWPMWEQFLKEGRIHRVIHVQRPDGTVIEVDFFATTNFLPGRHFSMLHDVTGQRRLEEQLRQSQKLESVGQLAGGIAHDFNNLLTVITGYAELTLKHLKKSDPLARNVEEIKKAADRAATLTRQLLAFSRKQVLQPKVLDLNTIIVNIEKMIGRLIGENMELRTLPSPGLAFVKADPGQIEQVILNLVVNARDAMPAGGKITIETANVYLDEAYSREHIAVQPGRFAMLAVTDSGHGMDTGTIKKIFEPFFTTKEQGKGTGLGLATVYGIVKQSGGNIWVYSEIGVGTTFKIYLPQVDEQISAPDADAAHPASAAGTETILLVEDEEKVRHLASESLRQHGYTVLEATDGEHALAICRQHEGPIDLLLTDVVMPKMSGKVLAEQLVRLRPDTWVLYMSGYANQAIVHQGILDEDISFIEKPFTPDGLVLKVVERLRQKPTANQSAAE